MAGPYKVTFTFACETGQGWSESWYFLSGGGLSLASAAAESLLLWRCPLLGDGSTLRNWTVIDTATPRLSVSRDKLLGVPQSFSAATDNPVSSQLGLVTCAPFAGRRQFWCRGIPDSWVVFVPATGLYQIVGLFKSAFENFATQITSGLWGLKTVKAVKASTLKSSVLSIQAQPITGFATLTLAAGTFPTTGVPAVVGGFKYPNQHLNGTFLYPQGYAVSGATFTYTNRFLTGLQSSFYVGGAYVRQQETSYQPITACVYDRPGDRKVGKIIGLPRGRRSSK